MPNKELLAHISKYVGDNVMSEFHNKKLEKISNLKLGNILKRKNPYLFKAKNATTAEDFIKPVLEASISSSEETIFGNFLEQIAIEVCKFCRHGRKSAIQGIDLEFEENTSNTKYLVTIKSGPNWSNSGQIKNMIDHFKKAERVIKTSKNSQDSLVVKFIEGCCYGYSKPDRDNRDKLCGERFWSFISNGNDNLYKDIIEPMGTKAKERNEAFMVQYGAKLNQLTQQFLNNFCTKDGFIDWEKLVTYNSAKDREKIKLMKIK